MGILIYASSPNRDGLTAECARAALDGVRSAGGEGEVVWLNGAGVGLCRACDRGWGTCVGEHRCQVEDGFQALHEQARAADGYVVVNPVYFGQLSESARAFFERLRRCEATRGEESALAGKPAVGVAAAGGSGGGTVTCLDELNRLLSHVRAHVFDLITVTQKSRPYKPAAIREAAAAMVRSMGHD